MYHTPNGHHGSEEETVGQKVEERQRRRENKRHSHRGEERIRDIVTDGKREEAVKRKAQSVECIVPLMGAMGQR